MRARDREPETEGKRESLGVPELCTRPTCCSDAGDGIQTGGRVSSVAGPINAVQQIPRLSQSVNVEAPTCWNLGWAKWSSPALVALSAPDLPGLCTPDASRPPLCRPDDRNLSPCAPRHTSEGRVSVVRQKMRGETLDAVSAPPRSARARRMQIRLVIVRKKERKYLEGTDGEVGPRAMALDATPPVG